MLPMECADRLREYLSLDSRRESACLVTVAWEIFPMANIASEPMYQFEVSAEDTDRMVSLLEEGRLYAIAHSHPGCKAFPSVYDVMQHQFPVRMLIYSGHENTLREYDPSELQRMADGLKGGEYRFALVRPASFQEWNFVAA